jgi:hypothetical protein
MERLEEWLSKEKLSPPARNCIRNFVLSCDNSNDYDFDNFVFIDTLFFRKDEQLKLIRGYIYAYYGLGISFYTPPNHSELFNFSLN